MPFILIKLADHSLDLTLAQSPNGTPLGCAQAIWMSDLLRVYWMDDEFFTHERIEKIRAMSGVMALKVLDEVKVTVDDHQWRWDKDFIDVIFKPLMSSED